MDVAHFLIPSHSRRQRYKMKGVIICLEFVNQSMSEKLDFNFFVGSCK